jgi:predicted CoA-binding protein
VDVVDVFRVLEHVSSIFEETVRLGVKALWLQKGVRHDVTTRPHAKPPRPAWPVVQDLCIKVELCGLLGKNNR